MSSRAQKLKSIVKGVESKPTFGTNPMDPWSAKAGISESESGLLKRYLLSRGIDPRYVTKDTRISHAKSGQFLKWKSDHISDRTTNEEVDKKDTVTFDIPLLIRVLEFTREDLKNDVNLHKMVERLLNIRDKGVLTMDEYQTIVKEEIQNESLANMVMAAAKDAGLKASIAKPSDERKKDTADMLAKRASDDKKAGIKRPLGGLYSKEYHPTVNKEEVVKEGSAALRMAQALRKEREAREAKDAAREAREKQQAPKPVKENYTCGSERSKSARIIKSLYKKFNMKEDTYDFEKDDKSIETYGKKPKVNKMDKDAEPSKSKIQAAAVLSGGTTLTGQSRDTVEIDPIMRVRPGQPDPTKNEKK